MASPNTHRRNAQLAPLKVTEHVITRALPGPRTAPGEFRELLAQSVRLRNERVAREHAARDAGRDIPISGPGRRRAKSHRNRGLCLKQVATVTGRCAEPAADGHRCPQHAAREQVDA